MRESQAFDLLMQRYGLVKASRLIQYAAMLQGMGEAEFDKVHSQQLRSKVSLEMVDAGVYWDGIEWDPGVAGWYVSMARRALKRSRRTA